MRENKWFLAGTTICVEFACSPHVCVGFLQSSGFLPHPKHVPFSVSVGVGVSVHSAMVGRTVQGGCPPGALSSQDRLQPTGNLNWNKWNHHLNFLLIF